MDNFLHSPGNINAQPSLRTTGLLAGRRNAGGCGVNPAELTRAETKASLADVRVPTGEREPHCALLTGCIVAAPLQTLTPGPAHTLSH